MKREIFGVVQVLAAGIAMGQETNPNWAVGGTVLVTNGYVLHTFTNAGVASNFVVTRSIPIPEVEVLVVGGGGHGGGLEYDPGGGGAGGVVHGRMEEVTGTNQVYVGNGSTNSNGYYIYSGENSYFGTWIAYGGGGGGTWDNGVNHYPKEGGSGGGAPSHHASGLYPTGAPSVQVSGDGYVGYGNKGGDGTSGQSADQPPTVVWYLAGGGGGAGGPGTNAWTTGPDQRKCYGGDGGPGVAIGITGSNVFYAGGGGGQTWGYGAQGGYYWGVGGVGGGGDASGNGDGDAGEPNTGGGGGAAQSGYVGGAGGSGIVIVRYFPAKLKRFTVHGKSMSAIRGNDIRSVQAPE